MKAAHAPVSSVIRLLPAPLCCMHTIPHTHCCAGEKWLQTHARRSAATSCIKSLHHVIALLNDVAAAAGVQFTTCSVIDLTEWREAVPAGAMWSSGLPRSDCNYHVLSIERRHLPLHPK